MLAMVLLSKVGTGGSLQSTVDGGQWPVMESVGNKKPSYVSRVPAPQSCARMVLVVGYCWAGCCSAPWSAWLLTTFSACGPLGPCAISNSTSSPSCKLL